jgi:hypothetical protein
MQAQDQPNTLPFPVEAQEMPLDIELLYIAELLRQQRELNEELGHHERMIAAKTAAVGKHYPKDGVTIVTVKGGTLHEPQLLELERKAGVFTIQLADPAPERPAPPRRSAKFAGVSRTFPL